jgi:DNA polymerase elongation subunit (family B)
MDFLIDDDVVKPEFFPSDQQWSTMSDSDDDIGFFDYDEPKSENESENLDVNKNVQVKHEDETVYPDFESGTTYLESEKYVPETIPFVDDFGLDPQIPTRIKKKEIDPYLEDTTFEIKYVTIERDEIVEDDPSLTKRRECAIYLHGNLKSGETVCVQFRGYRLYFYLQIPEHSDKEKDLAWKNNFMKTLAADKDLPIKELYSADLEYKLPTTGFRNFEPLPHIKFSFYTLNAFYRYKHALEKLFPPPTEEEIKKKIYRNDVMLCEHAIPHDMKFMNYHSLSYSGWGKLSAGTYFNLLDKSRAMYTFHTYCIEPVNDDEIADSTIHSLDIEAVRHDGLEAMPDPTNIKDVTAMIGHAVESTNRTFPRMYYVFSWGGPIVVPPTDRKGNPLPERKIIYKIYKDEASMLTHWARWMRDTRISPDCIIGWNIYGFDMSYLMTRIMILDDIDPDVKEWGRLHGYVTKIKDSNIESKAIAYQKYRLTPSPGIIFVDCLIPYQRDVTLRLPNYLLKTVGKHFLKEEKNDVHYSEIKGLFYGTPTERGILAAYNIQDCELVLNLFYKNAQWPKMTNVCRINKVGMEVLCPRGQQIRVFGGFHKHAMDGGFVASRPHYHPILDEPIVEDPKLWDKGDEKRVDRADTKFDDKGDVDSLIDYWNKMLNIGKFKVLMSVIKVDESGVAREEDLNVENVTNTENIPGVIHVVEESPNIKVYGKDVNPFSNKKQTKNTKASWVTRDGLSIDEVAKMARSRRKRKFVLQDSGMLKAIPIVGKNTKLKGQDIARQEESEKGFAGGYVMEPERGFYTNVSILDFNALYPNIMMSYFLDPSNLVLDPKYANCPGVTYLRLRFSKTKEFLFAQGFPGVMTKHARALVVSRKAAQGVMETYALRVNTCGDILAKLLNLSSDTKVEDTIKKANSFLNNIKNEPRASEIVDSKSIYDSLIKKEIEIIVKTLNDFAEFNELKPYFDKDYASLDVDTIIDESEDISEKLNNEKVRLILRECFKLIDKYKELSIGEGCQNVCYMTNFILGLLQKYESDFINYNSKQNELKIGANSTFGFLSAGGKISYHPETKRIDRRSMMQVMPVSACITYIGRKTIEAAKEHVENNYKGSKVIYADTDSLFIKFPESMIPDTMEGMNMTFKLSAKIAEEITRMFKFPGSSMKIEHEKTARYIIIYSAKCYALDKYTKMYPEDKGKVEVKGLTFSKRDCCKFVSNVCKRVLDMILKEGKLKESQEYVTSELFKMINGQIPDEDLKIYKKLSKKVYSSTNVQSHAQLAQKINKRKPGLGPKSGESVQYLFIDVGLDADQKSCQRQLKKNNVKCGNGYIEDYDHVIENNIKIDKLWYLKNQCTTNITKLFGPLVDDPMYLLNDVIKEQTRRQYNMASNTTIIDQLSKIGFLRKKAKIQPVEDNEIL